MWLLFHRWGGLLMAIPLILVALTGSIIAFTKEVNRYVITPERYATVQPGVPQLGMDVLAKHAQALALPGETIDSLNVGPDFANVRVQPQADPSAKAEKGGKAKAPLVYAIWLDPWTGKELARQYPVNGEPIRDNRLMRFFHALHDHLYLGREYMWVLGIIALLWTVDCFVSWYLTLPNSSKEFWRRWKLAWKIKTGASAYRLNYDLHRANGLWLWPILFVFAWSSVYLNLPMVYDPVTKALFDFKSRTEQIAEIQTQIAQQKLAEQKFMVTQGEPQTDMATNAATAMRLAVEESARQRFATGYATKVTSVNRRPGSHLVGVSLRSDEARCDELRENKCFVNFSFDARNGQLFEWKEREIPVLDYANEPTGNFITRWIIMLHFGQSLGLAYKIFVSVLGIIIAMLSITGIYIWWKKRKARKQSEAKKAEIELSADVAS